MNAKTVLGIFRDRSGSTTITVILALILSCALMGSCLQWYWVNTTSMDIQAVADLGALAAGEVIAQTVMVIQTLDAFLLTLSLFGLLLHCAVLVTGTVIVVASAAGSEVGIEFFDKLVRFDQDFCDRRKEIVTDVKVFAEALCAATPLLAYARGAAVVAQNQENLGANNQSAYVGIIIPAPLIGTVEMSNDPEELESFEQDMRTSGTENHESAQRIKDLEQDLEAAIDRCFALDIYKSPATARAFWNPTRALADFRAGWESTRKTKISAPLDPLPVDDTPSTRAQAAQRYLDAFEQAIGRVSRAVSDAIGPDPLGDAPMTPSMLSIDSITGNDWNHRVLILDHLDGERKAYHTRSDCFGLSSASETLREVSLSTLRGQLDHPPCTWCAPPSWKAIDDLEDGVSSFLNAWNQEAQAILEYEMLRAHIDQEVSTVQERTAEKLQDILDMATGYLMGSRLTYEPSGGRGLYCIVVNASTRSLPAYTLPSLTGARDVELGHQVAVSAVRLLPSASETTLPSLLNGMKADEATDAGLGGVVRAMMGEDEVIVSYALALWGSCLDLYTDQVGDVVRLGAGLPWGLGPVVENTTDTLLETAQISVPDMRRPLPTVVPIHDVGDTQEVGIEGILAQTFGGGRSLLESTGGMSTFGIIEQMRDASRELSEAPTSMLDNLLHPTILGVALHLTFLETILGDSYNPLEQGIELLYELPVPTW